MPDTRVVVLYGRSLFAAGIESRLRTIDRLEVIRVDAAETGALARISQIAPDAVIVDAHDGGFVAGTTILELLDQNGAARVIVLDLKRDEISIYRREGRLVLTSAELVAAIQGFVH
ncbi:MAG: hypothetical protein M5U01_37390 [Ardenticatenaceae bacterium]|nr:hypothetical protein [Ardenticatenaceae bacterium]HBY93704.1 hypothetical protein [Chloroflexota bacterium]